MDKGISVDNQGQIEINMTKDALFNYMLINSTKGFGMLVWGISCIAVLLVPYSIYHHELRLLAISGIIIYLNLIVKPLNFRSNAANQMLQNEAFSHPIYYNFSEEGVVIKQSLGEALFTWDQFIRVEERKKMLLLYVSKEQAFIIIKSQVKEQELDKIRATICKAQGIKHNIKG